MSVTFGYAYGDVNINSYAMFRYVLRVGFRFLVDSQSVAVEGFVRPTEFVAVNRLVVLRDTEQVAVEYPVGGTL
jgi:hypothetical protein